MSANKKTGWIWVTVTLVLLVGGQVLNKLAADGFSGASLERFISPLFITAFLVLLIRGFTWLAALKFLPLSAAYPVLSVSFPIIMVLSLLLFDETIALKHILGSALILLGVFLIARES